MTTITATADRRGAATRAHGSSRPPRRASAALAVRAAMAAVAALCVGLHVWLAVGAPDWRSLAMLALAAACAACMLHRGGTALPSTGEWSLMAVAALAMLVVHLTGVGGAGGHHAAALVGGSGDADAPIGGATAAVHALAPTLAAIELGVAMLALVVGGARRRSERGCVTTVVRSRDAGSASR